MLASSPWFYKKAGYIRGEDGRANVISYFDSDLRDALGAFIT